MYFTPRLRQILLVLLEQNSPVSVQSLADDIHVSKRTVQRELEYVGSTLKECSLRLATKTGLGIWLEGKEENKKILQSMLKDREVIDCADKEERRKRLMLELLKEQCPKKLYYYSNLFGVSEATVSKDMERVEPWFRQFDLTIIRKQGFGVVLQGSEKNYRLAIRKFIEENVNRPLLIKTYEENKPGGDKSRADSGGDIYKLIDNEILHRVRVCFTSIRDERITKLTEESYISLILHAGIAIERLLKGDGIEADGKLLEKLKNEEDFKLALLIVNSLEQEFEIEIPDIEIAYLSLHIKGAKMQRTNHVCRDEKSRERYRELTELVKRMVIAFDEALSPVLEADEEFINGLAIHLQPTIVRLRNHLPIENPHLKEIKEAYPGVFHKCMKVGRFLEAALGYDIPESEIGFLAFHFGAAMVRLENENKDRRKVYIGLVCASGIGISRLMSSRLQKFLHERAHISTYGREELTPFILNKNDFFVSNLYLEDIEADVLHVNPLLPDEDLARINERVAYYEKLPKKEGEESDFAKQLEKVNLLAGKVKEVIKNFQYMDAEGEADFSSLVREAAGKITPYKENSLILAEDILNRERIATQVIPELQIALLHAISRGVFHPGFYICKAREGEVFTHPYLKKTRTIVIIVIPDDNYKEVNSRILGFLSEKLAEEGEFLSCILFGKEKEIREQVTALLKQYFNAYLDKVTG